MMKKLREGMALLLAALLLALPWARWRRKAAPSPAKNSWSPARSIDLI